MEELLQSAIVLIVLCFIHDGLKLNCPRQILCMYKFVYTVKQRTLETHILVSCFLIQQQATRVFEVFWKMPNYLAELLLIGLNFFLTVKTCLFEPRIRLA